MIASDRRGLDSQVLLLNRFYMPMQVISARQAFTLLCRESAEVIDVDHGHFYNSVSYTHLTLPTNREV